MNALGRTTKTLRTFPLADAKIARALAAIAFAFTLAVAAPAGAAETDAVEADAVEEALRNSASHNPWYDPETEAYRPAPVLAPSPVFDPDASEWKKKPPAAQTPVSNVPSFFSGWNWASWGYIFRGLFWVVLVIAAVGLVALILFVLGRMEWGGSQKRKRANKDEEENYIDRIEALPIKLRSPQSDYLSEARRHYEAGEYNEAVVYLYAYQLLQLDRKQFLRLALGRTNRQYLRDLRRQRSLHSLMQQTVLAFEDAFFGNKALTRGQFDRVWDRLDEFHKMLEQPAMAA